MLVDFELIRRAQKGDSAAFNEVVLAYRKRILGTIARLIARPDDVEDVGQEVGADREDPGEGVQAAKVEAAAVAHPTTLARHPPAGK